MSTIFSPENKASLSTWDFQSKNSYIEIRIRRNTAIAIIVSLVVHSFVLFAFYPKKLVEGSSIAKRLPKSISVQLAGLPSKKITEEIKPQKPQPSIIATKNSAITAPRLPISPPPLNATNNPQKDFMSFVRDKKQRAQDLENYAARENAKAQAPSDDEQRDEIIKRNFQQSGTSGIFSIRRKSSQTAQFSFKGWKNNNSIPQLELVDVEAGSDGDIDLAIVKKMIDIIRREYKGDFNWESQRLGRVVVLSARMEDNAGLETFLKQEFFSGHDF